MRRGAAFRLRARPIAARLTRWVGLARNGWPDGTPGNTNRRNCPPGQPGCDPET
jgi:hypothetical protein